MASWLQEEGAWREVAGEQNGQAAGVAQDANNDLEQFDKGGCHARLGDFGGQQPEVGVDNARVGLPVFGRKIARPGSFASPIPSPPDRGLFSQIGPEGCYLRSHSLTLTCQTG